MNWFVIDPGVNTGWVELDKKKVISHGIIRGKGKNWRHKYSTVVNNLELMSIYLQPVFIEFPSFQNIQAQNTHSIIKLSFLVGRIYERFKGSRLINVSEWRGNCPKEILWRRAEKFFKLKEKLKDHEGDAVAIAQYVIENNLI